MKQKLVRITENDLRNAITYTVKNILKESWEDDWFDADDEDYTDYPSFEDNKFGYCLETQEIIDFEDIPNVPDAHVYNIVAHASGYYSEEEGDFDEYGREYGGGMASNVDSTDWEIESVDVYENGEYVNTIDNITDEIYGQLDDVDEEIISDYANDLEYDVK